MVQSCFYDFYEKKYYLRDDKNGWSDFKYYPTYYVKDENGDQYTLEGDCVSAVKKMDDYKNPKYYEKDVDKVTRLLVDTYYETDDTPTYHNIVALDIECEILGALTPESIKAANAKITSISLYEANSKKYYCLILDEQNNLSNINNPDKEVVPFSTEAELLQAFLAMWEQLDPTIITGWNSGYFDIPYLYYRISKVLSQFDGKRLSPIGKIKMVEYDSEQPVVIGGINHLDYMLLFKKFIMKQEPSYRLNDIGIKYAKLGKVEYQGSLDNLFKEDPEKFIEYNIRDVEIIVELEKRMKFIELTIAICHLCHTEYEQIYYSTMLNEGAILTYLKRKGVVSPNKPTTYNPYLKEINPRKAEALYRSGQMTKDEYEEILLLAGYAGGYLKDPIPGLYDWVIDLDFTSLYPSIIRSLNMGIETLVGRVVNNGKFDNQWSLRELKLMDPNKLVAIEKVKKDRTVISSSITVGKLVKLIEQNNYVISAPGVIFRKDVPSVVCEILTDWFKKRQEYKALMKDAYKVKNDPVLGEFYNSRQHAYKIKLNDVYGVFAQNGWRYTDGNKFISKAITLTGQRLLKESISHMNNYINKQLKSEDKDYIITSDTDSLFIQVKDLALNRNPELINSSKEEWVKYILEIATELQQVANQHMHTLVKDLFNINYPDEPHYFELKQEVVLERGYFAGKRRYAMHIVNKEGVPTDELVMMGLDLMKSNFPPLFRNFGEHILKEIMYGKSKESIDEQLLVFRESLRTIDWHKILKPTGLKQMANYIAAKPGAGEMFSRLGLKCPINTKAAIYTSDLLKFNKLDKIYPIPGIGDKIYIAYLKQNPYNIDVLSLNGYNDAPLILDIVEKYIDRDKIFESVMKNKLDGIYSDIGWSQPVFNRNINKFFIF
jgi:DNA polymerase elongation subunit (family B)